MKQITLVALYGEKASDLNKMILRITEMIQHSAVGQVFRPYDLKQIHGTIVGMEKLTGYSACYNSNIWNTHGEKIPMDFSGLHPILSGNFPIDIQFGGFNQDSKDFSSFGKSPYERSLQIQWATNRVTLIGWPHRDGDYSNSMQLSNLRQSLSETCRINHKYQRDNDFFMSIGEIAPLSSLPAEKKEALFKAGMEVEREIRDYLASNAINIHLDLDDLSIAQYQLTTLCPKSTVPHAVTKTGLNSRFICSLYL